MTNSRIFLYFSLAFAGGIGLSSVVFLPRLAMLGILILGVYLISVFWDCKKLAVFGFCFLFIVLGIWRHQSVLSKIVYPKEQEVVFVGNVVEEPDIRADNINLIIQPDNDSRFEGKVLVAADKYPDYEYGDELKITGTLQAAQNFDDFNYREYLAKNGIYAVMYWPKIELLATENYRGVAPVIYAGVLRFKERLRESVYNNLPPPQSSILGAMILGDKNKMSDELKEKLNIAGLRHITAISGMHVTIISLILMQFLTGMGFWRNQAFYATLLFLALFIIMVGLPPSAVRAGFMAGSFLLAQKLGRPSSALRLVVLAAALMLALNPLLLSLDIGFQLSFLAVTGIIVLGPHFKRRLMKIPEKKFINMRSILSMTLSAQIFTLPILVFNFGQVSLTAPLANVLVLPLLPFILGFGFLAGVAGMVWQPLGLVFSLPAWLFLTYLVKIIDWFSAFPFAAVNF